MPFTALAKRNPARRLGTYFILACAFMLLFHVTVRGQASCSVANFGPAATFNVRSVRAIVVADLNADGKLDMATANESPSTVSVLLGDGTGGFGPTAHFAAGRNPRAIATGDFNGDGKLDLVTANGSNIQGDLTILPGDGAGGFGNFIQVRITSPGINHSTNGVAVGNFNGDAYADIVATAGAGVSILLGNGANGFTIKSFGLGAPAIPAGVAVADFNKDGLADVAVANTTTDAVNILLGDGAGNLGAAANFTAGSDPTFLVTGDFNGDANLDIATEDAAVLLGNGSGGFAAPTLFSMGGPNPTAVTPADFNGDGKLDLAVTNSDLSNAQFGNVLILQGDGAGGFSPAANYTAGGRNPQAVAAGDLNGDGRPDLIVGNQASQSVAIRLNTCGGAATPSALQFASTVYTNLDETGATTITVIRTGPLQGTASVAYATSDGTAGTADYTPAAGTLTFAEGETTKTFNVSITEDNISEDDETINLTLSNVTGAATLGSPSTALLLIFRSDGTPTLSINDVAVTEGDNGTIDAVFTVTLSNPSAHAVTVDFATAGGSAAADADYVSASGTLTFNPGETSRTLTVKVNGDTLDETNEVFFVNLTNPTRATIADAQGTGTILEDDASCPAPSFAAPTSFAAGAGAWPVVTGDFNGDGALDFAVGNFFASIITVQLGTGQGGSAATIAAGVRPRSLAVADFNGDGKLDLAATGGDFSTQVSILLGDGAGGFAAPSSFTSGTGTNVALAANDFNADGKTDLAVVNISAASVALHLGDGAGGFAAATNFTVGTSPFSVTAADLNGDGRPDLAVPNQNSNNVSVLLNQAGGGFAPATNFAAGENPQHVAVADFNGDGKLDLAVTNANSADASILLGDGAGGFAAATSAATGARPYAITAADFNGDGHPDLAVSHAAGGGETVAAQLSVLFGNGAGAFSPPSDFIPGGNSLGLAAADFNGDGRPDLAVSSFGQTAGSVSLLLNSCSSAVSPARVQFSSPVYSVAENGGSAIVTVVRSGDASAPASVAYATSDGTASERGDYTTALGRLNFAAGETTKTFIIFITNDVFVEGEETVVLTLSDAAGAAVGAPATATLTISSDDVTTTTANPMDDAAFFVRQHYRDFLNREADPAGLAFWTGEILACQQVADPQARAFCIEDKRNNVSAAFFLSIEFQETGYLVYRFYRASFLESAERPRGLPRYREFLRDTQRIGQGVVVGQTGWEAQLEANKQAFALAWVERADFLARFPTTMEAAEYVDQLFQTAGLTPTVAERDAALNEFNSAAVGLTGQRARALRRVAENERLVAQEFNRAFVLMQYFGYLRRNPDDAPDTNFGGYDFWLGKLEEHNGNFIRSQMVLSFLLSSEYRNRFGQ